MSRMILIRGLPGSGKSTLANMLMNTSYLHLEADQFFCDPETGEYRYDPVKIEAAHKWCQDKARRVLVAGCFGVIVANTFSRKWELKPYFDMAVEFGIEPLVIETKGAWQNIHGVSDEVIRRMRDRWEHL